MGYSAAKVSTHLELEKNRGYWRAKGFDRDSCQLSLSRGEEKIERTAVAGVSMTRTINR
ncbi:hypothetical protein OM311_15620 [Escherichia albertii]|nr:hypothetical protein [Escherichia albertii]